MAKSGQNADLSADPDGDNIPGNGGARGVAVRRLLGRGFESAPDAELLFLWLGLPDAASGQVLLDDLGGASGLLEATGRELLRRAGWSRARVVRLLAARALMERGALAVLEETPVLSCTASVRRYLRTRLARAPREIFACLFLDNRHRLIRYEELFLGTVDRANVHPREVLRRALELNAAAIILAHNHPSGVAEPSVSDVSLTRDLTELLARVDVRVLDHLVVGRGLEVSFAERGLL